jgi:hypothetical protein
MDISASFVHIAGQWVSASCYTPEIKFFTANTIDLLAKFYTVLYFRRSCCNSWLTDLHFQGEGQKLTLCVMDL